MNHPTHESPTESLEITEARSESVKPTRQIKPLSHELFTGERSTEYNALRSAIRTAAENSNESGEYAEYDWLAKVPRTSMTVELVDALHEHGYQITKEWQQ